MSSGGLVQESKVVVGERSTTSCAVAWWQGQVHLAWTGSDTHLNTMWSADGQRFGGKQTLRHRSSRSTTSTTSYGSGPGYNGTTTTTTVEALAPALLATESSLHLGWTGTNRHLNVSHLRLA